MQENSKHTKNLCIKYSSWLQIPTWLRDTDKPKRKKIYTFDETPTAPLEQSQSWLIIEIDGHLQRLLRELQRYSWHWSSRENTEYSLYSHQILQSLRGIKYKPSSSKSPSYEKLQPCLKWENLYLDISNILSVPLPCLHISTPTPSTSPSKRFY